MKELSLHILDIVQNSIKANASFIKIIIDEDIGNDELSIIIEDNGYGMSDQFLKKVINPFVTTRTTRNIGLGIPLMIAATKRCEGSFNITSIEGEGTKVECQFRHSHIDRAPLGAIAQTMVTIINSCGDTDVEYIHRYQGEKFKLDTREIKNMLDGVDISTNNVLLWIGDYVKEGISTLYKEES